MQRIYTNAHTTLGPILYKCRLAVSTAVISCRIRQHKGAAARASAPFSPRRITSKGPPATRSTARRNRSISRLLMTTIIETNLAALICSLASGRFSAIGPTDSDGCKKTNLIRQHKKRWFPWYVFGYRLILWELLHHVDCIGESHRYWTIFVLPPTDHCKCLIKEWDWQHTVR